MNGETSDYKAASSSAWLDRLGKGLRRFNASVVLFLAGTVGFWVALHNYSEKLKEVWNIDWERVAISIIVPLGVYLLVFVLPGWLRRRRDHILEEWAVKGQPRHGYFRLVPYEEADHQRFRRDDETHVLVLEWLRRAPEPLLYLTGRSGTGKSSLLSAYVLPKIQEGESPTRTVTLRASGDVVTTLRAELRKPGALYEQPPKDLPTEILPSCTGSVTGSEIGASGC